MMEQIAAPHLDGARGTIAGPRTAFLALGLVLLLGVGVVAALMLFNGQRLDERADQTSIATMQAGIDERADQLDRVAEDYAWSNEAVEAIQLRRDRAWAEARLGSVLHRIYPYDWAFVIAPDGSTIHAAREGDPVADDITKALGNDQWRPLVERSRSAVVDHEPQAVHGYTSMRERRLGIISAAAIMPKSSWTGPRPEGAPYVLVVVRSLTSTWLSELAAALGLSDLRFSLSSDRPTTVLRLAGPGGRPVGSVSWQARRPGTEYLTALVPALGVALVLLLAFMWSAWRLSRAAPR